MKWIQSRPDFIKNSLAIVVVLVIGVLGVVLLTASRAATGATLSLSSSSTTVTPGSNFSVTIKEDSGSDPVNSIQAALNYNASQLQFVGISEGGTFTTIAATDTSTPGVIRVARATQASPATGVNDVVTVNFKVLASSGSINLSFDNNYSFIVRSTDSADVLSTTTGSTFAVSGGSAASASMSLSPAAVTATTGSTFTVTIRENSGSVLVNSVQSAVNYDAAKLQYTGLTEGGTFTNIAATDTSTAGKVRVARSVQVGSAGISGDNPIVTLSFKVLASSGTTSLTLDKDQSFVVDAGTNGDVLTTVAGNTITIEGAPPATSTLSLSPTSGTYAKDSTITVNVSADSASKLTTVQSTLEYPADKLQYVSVTEGGVFTTVQRTNSGAPGKLDIIRSLPGGAPGVSGKNPVVTVTFKVIADSGSAPVAFASTSALYDDSGTGTNILNLNGSVTASYTLKAGTVTPPPQPPTGGASINLSPSSGSFAPDSTISVAIKVNSSDSAVTTVQSVLNYPASQLQYVNTTNSATFPTAQRTNTNTAGVVDIIRSISGGGSGVNGENIVATVNFKVIGTSGAAAITLGNGSAVYDNSGTGTNIMDVSSSNGANYTITGAPSCSTNPSTPGTPVSTSTNYTTATFSWTASSAGSNCTLGGYRVYRNGVQMGDVTNGTSYTDSGLTSGTSYSYTVRAFDTAGHTSNLSTAASIKTKTDDMSPTTPTAVTAAAPNAASVNLSWSPSTDFPNPGGVGVQGYKIYRNNATTATYTVTNGTSFIDSNVTSNTTYTYTITAYDMLGNESAPSNAVSAKTQPATANCAGNPTVPANLTSSSDSPTSITLSWTASTAAENCTLSGYRVFRGSTQIGTANGTTYIDTRLQANTSYNYTVQAYDTDGHSSAISAARTAVTQADTTAPSAPATVMASAPSPGQVTLTWGASTDDVEVVGYRIYRDGTRIGNVGSTIRTYSDTTVAANSDYGYTVSAIDAAGNESTRASASPSPIHTPSTSDSEAPTTPQDLRSITIASNSVVLAWNPSTDNTAVAGYHVYRFGVRVGDATGTTFTDTNLESGTNYTYTVRAYDAAGNVSSASNEVSVLTNKPTGTLVGDLNADGVVDVYDLSILLSHWHEMNVPVRFGDIDQDGVVDSPDLSTLLSHLGERS